MQLRTFCHGEHNFGSYGSKVIRGYRVSFTPHTLAISGKKFMMVAKKVYDEKKNSYQGKVKSWETNMDKSWGRVRGGSRVSGGGSGRVNSVGGES
jgi:hypothetical protein